MKLLQDAPAAVRLMLAFLFCMALEGVGALLFVRGRMTDWWPTLRHPPWAPPVWAWIPIGALFNVMAVVVLYRSWNGMRAGFPAAPFWGMASLVVANQLRAGLFFGLESPLAGFFGLIPYAALAIWLFTRLWRWDRPSGLLFAPYILWIAFDFVWTASLAGL